MAVNSPFVLMLIVLATLRVFSIIYVNQILYRYECFVIIKIFDFQHWAFSRVVISMWEKNSVSIMELDSGMLNSKLVLNVNAEKLHVNSLQEMINKHCLSNYTCVHHLRE